MHEMINDGAPELRRLPFTFAFLLSLLSVSCTNGDTLPESSDLSAKAPFGLGWDGTDQYSVDEGDCRNIVASITHLLSVTETEVVIDACLIDQVSGVFLSAEEIPEWFRRGELSVELAGGNLPVSYTYSYLHNLNVETPVQNSQRRQAHAKKIRKTLNQLYGRPLAKGHFEQFSKFGFVVSDETTPPCEYWQIDDVGVLLCSERVVLLDGYEMSLSFTRLDRAKNGGAFLDMLATPSVEEHTAQNDNYLLEESDETSISSALRTVSRFANRLKFRNCQRNDLKPLNEILQNDVTADLGLADILNRYEGDELAKYVFDNFGALGSQLTNYDEDTAALLLLKRAADQGSPLGMNEVGASLLYCYLGVEQDTGAAADWLGRAADGNNALAMASLARMQISGVSEGDPVEALRLGLDFLDRCAEIDPDLCEGDLNALWQLADMLGDRE